MSTSLIYWFEGKWVTVVCHDGEYWVKFVEGGKVNGMEV